MPDSCLPCNDGRPTLSLSIYTPSRGNDDTVHNDVLEKVLVGFTLPTDLLVQNILITVTSKHTSGSVIFSTQIHAMVSRTDANTPNIYTAEIATLHNMRDQDSDIAYDVVANGDAGINITITDDSGDAGTITSNFQIWVLDEMLLS